MFNELVIFELEFFIKIFIVSIFICEFFLRFYDFFKYLMWVVIVVLIRFKFYVFGIIYVVF